MAEQITSDNFERFRVIHLKTQRIKSHCPRVGNNFI